MTKTLKSYFEAAYHLLLFIPYTELSRSVEIILGIFTWLNIIIIIYTII